MLVCGFFNLSGIKFSFSEKTDLYKPSAFGQKRTKDPVQFSHENDRVPATDEYDRLG